MSDWDLMTVALVVSALAALASALGVMPFFGERRVAPVSIAIAQALASGFMLGIGYLLLFQGLQITAPAVLLGSLVGVGYTLAVQTVAGVRELHRERSHANDPSIGYRALLEGTLHSASEGLAIGVALAVSVNLGLFMAGALALHNVGESMALTQVLQRNRLGTLQLGLLAVVSKSSQVLMALLALLLVNQLGGPLELIIGIAAGSLFFLVLTELLPAAYSGAPKKSVAAAASLGAAIVVLLEGVIV